LLLADTSRSEKPQTTLNFSGKRTMRK